ncbi:MAG: adenosylmethionine decarboxylase [Candidatus Magasanikbacteria bacterium]|nr:adenosylmethionine decarboxylase [Candidatus Magasanikbacteria bacterium]
MPELKKSFRIGREILADLRGCDPRVIDDEQLLRRLVQEAIKKTKHNLLELNSRKFTPVGVTVLGILAESHISLHTYPEIGYVGVDIFTCGKNRPEPILEYLQEKFGAKEVNWQYLRRGSMRQWKQIYFVDGYKREIEVMRVLHTQQTPYQLLEVMRAKHLGVCLFSNGTLQMATADAHIYDQKMIQHMGNAKNALIVGGGDCSILKELVKNTKLQEIYMFEQDQQVINVAKKYLGAGPALRDKRLKMFYGDALETIPFLKDKKIDYAVIDLVSLPDSKLKPLYSSLFKELSSIKVPRWATQAGHVLDKKELTAISSAAKNYYKKTEVETQWYFSGGEWNFLYGEGIKK